MSTTTSISSSTPISASSVDQTGKFIKKPTQTSNGFLDIVWKVCETILSFILLPFRFIANLFETTPPLPKHAGLLKQDRLQQMAGKAAFAAASMAVAYLFYYALTSKQPPAPSSNLPNLLSSSILVPVAFSLTALAAVTYCVRKCSSQQAGHTSITFNSTTEVLQLLAAHTNTLDKNIYTETFGKTKKLYQQTLDLHGIGLDTEKLNPTLTIYRDCLHQLQTDSIANGFIKKILPVFINHIGSLKIGEDEVMRDDYWRILYTLQTIHSMECPPSDNS